ncbi:sigma factor [Chitinophaga sp. 212800010-3]|uniref:sigma factor n=1 Tax=unclassified Chitinophaga TaxID=2619133 RepID=UPI003FA4CFE8
MAEDLYKQFKSAFEQYYAPLCKYTFNFTKQQHACEDIVQEVFVRIWGNPPDLVWTGIMRYYLFTAVRNNCITYLRNLQRLPTYCPVRSSTRSPFLF